MGWSVVSVEVIILLGLNEINGDSWCCFGDFRIEVFFLEREWKVIFNDWCDWNGLKFNCLMVNWRKVNFKLE